jgi:hypothetical protein
MSSPEVRDALRRNDRAAVTQWIKEGRLKLSPDNPMAARLGAQ